MIQLDKYQKVIENFIFESIEKFKITHDSATSAGIYCNSNEGWITTNFNVNNTIEETGNNCPDFEYVEFGYFEIEGWQEEFELNAPTYTFKNHTFVFDKRSGDEKLNEFMFHFLQTAITSLKLKNNTLFLLQMLDSRFSTVI